MQTDTWAPRLRVRQLPHAGSWALELQLEPISGATKYGLATKFHVSERSAARLGFLMTLDTEDSEDSRREERTDIYGTTTTTSGSESSFDQTSGSVFLHYVRYATVADRFGLSLDAGPVGRRRCAIIAATHGHPSC